MKTTVSSRGQKVLNTKKGPANSPYANTIYIVLYYTCDSNICGLFFLQVFLHFARKQGDGLVDEDDEFEDDHHSVRSGMTNLTNHSNGTIRSLFSVISGHQTIRRRGRFRVEDHLRQPSMHDQVQFSMEDWNYSLPDDLIDYIKQAPSGPDGKTYLRETLSSQLPPNLRHAPAAVLGRYLAPSMGGGTGGRV